jgi:hypothetical protein
MQQSATISDPSLTQMLDRRQKHFLDQIRCGLGVAQMTEPVQTHPRRQPRVQLTLGRGCIARRSGSDRSSQVCIAERPHFHSEKCNPAVFPGV